MYSNYDNISREERLKRMREGYWDEVALPPDQYPKQPRRGVPIRYAPSPPPKRDVQLSDEGANLIAQALKSVLRS